MVADKGLLDFEIAPTIALTIRTTDANGNFYDEAISLSVTDVVNEVRYGAGTELLVNTATQNNQLQPTITSLASGGFVVSWIDDSFQGGDASSYGIKAQIFDAAGAKVGTEFLVNTATFNSQGQPTITSLSSGGFAVSWTDYSGQNGDASSSGIMVRVFTLQTIEGTAGNHFLAGTSNNDTFYGRGGNDIYIVNHVDDVVNEAANAGTDEVRTSLGSRTDYTKLYILPANVENLTGTSLAGQGVTGNSLDNVITMGAGGDLVVLHDGGNDTVSGGEGNDFFYYGGALDASDSNDGGIGYDTVGLLGTYDLMLGANSLVNIEKLAMYSGGSDPGAVANNYTIATVDGECRLGCKPDGGGAVAAGARDAGVLRRRRD